MLKKTLPALLIVFVMNLGITSFAATGKAEKDLKFAEKVKAGVAKLGTGENAKIEVKLKDGTKLKGYISESSDEQFVITDMKTGKTIPVSYPQVAQVKGNNLSTAVKIAIGVGIIFGIAIILVLIAGAQGD